jgi:hypothetical protein
MISCVIWILFASLLGFSVAAIFSGLLKLNRNIYLLFYVPLVLCLFILFILSNKINILDILTHNWYWGLLGAILAAAFVIKNVFSQPSSPRNKGLALLSDILWPGIVYGLMDSLLLSVLPILSVQSALTNSFWHDRWMGRIALGLLALLASFFVTTSYHLGYQEFRGKKVIWPNVGNGILSLAYFLTMNPLAAILPHIGMHVAAMIHGKDTTGQVPPHYND